MERRQGPIDPCFLGECLDVEGLQQGYINIESLRFGGGEEEKHQFLMSSLEDKIPFLQMLQSVESPPFFPFKAPNFQTLLKLQHFKGPWDINTCATETENQVQVLELESCVTHDTSDLHSTVKSEIKGLQNRLSASCHEDVSPDPNHRRANSIGRFCRERNSSSPRTHQEIMLNKTHCSKSCPVVPKERRKRKRARPMKNKEEIESQRMTHIAVERNRRRQMNDHLNSLRALIPPSYFERGDQASIIGGAIEFVKELEQLLQSLEAQKRMKKTEAAIGISSDGLFTLQAECNIQRDMSNCEEEAKVKIKSEAAKIEVTAVQNRAQLKILCARRAGQLLRAIVALEDLRLTVLDLNISSSDTSVLYTFNLKIEDDCKVDSADEIAATVDQIFSTINGT